MVESYYDISSPTSKRNILFIIKTFLCVSTGCFVRAFPIETCCIRFVYELSRSRNKFIYFIAVNGISGSKRSFSGRFTTFHRNIDTDFIDTGNSNITSEGCFCYLIIVFHGKSKRVFSGFRGFETVNQGIGSLNRLPVQNPLIRRLGTY